MNYAENIESYLAVAGDDDITAGREWYAMANRQAREIASAYGITLLQSAGVLAALSPQCPWSENVAGAVGAVAVFQSGGTVADACKGFTGYPENMRKAFAILADADFGVCATCTPSQNGKHRRQCDASLRGPKVVAFYRAILGDADGAVDVWATRAADIAFADLAGLAPDDPRRDGIPGNRHDDITAAYRVAGQRYGLAGHEAQAVVWVTIRKHYLKTNGHKNHSAAMDKRLTEVSF